MSILGLPLHPLVVHAVVILLPLGALGALALVVRPRLRAAYGWLTVGVTAAGAGAAVVAFFSGRALAAELGLAGTARLARHEAFGTWVPWPALALLASLAVLVWASGPGRDRPGLVRGSGAATVLTSMASLVLVVLAGHAGASAVWGR